MLASNGKISLRQLQILIILSALGTGIIVLPRRVAQYAGTDGWQIVALLGVFAVAIGILISKAVEAMARAYPGEGFVGTCSKFFSKPIAYIICILFWLKIVFSAGLELRAFMTITQLVLLPSTPLAATSIFMLLVCTYAATKGMETRARVAEVLLLAMFIPFIAIISLAVYDTNITNLQPAFVTSPRSVIHGALRLGFIFTGLECLLLVSPFLNRHKNMWRRVAVALATAGIIIFVICVLAIAKLGTDIIYQPWPVLRFMDMISIPGSFIERQAALMFSFWIVTAFALCSALVFFGGHIIKDVFTRQRSVLKKQSKFRHISIYVTAAAVCIVSLVPWADVYAVLDMLYFYGGAFFMILLPLAIIAATSCKLRRVAKVSILLVAVFSTGCWDSIELEQRAFVVSMAIDKDDVGYQVSVSIPPLDPHSKNEKTNDKDDEDNAPHVKTAIAASVNEALKLLETKTDKTLFYGQTKLVVFGRDLLEDAEMLAHVTTALTKHNDIDMRINVLAANDTALEILQAKPPDETLPGLFVAELYRNKRKLNGQSFALDLETFESRYASGMLLPIIGTGEKEAALVLSGAAIVQGRKLHELTHKQLQGYMWGINHAMAESVTTLNGTPVTITSHKVKHGFYMSGGELHVVLDIRVKIKDAEDTKLSTQLEQELVQHIATQVTTSMQLVQNYADTTNWQDKLRKADYKLYLALSQDWQQVQTTIKIIPRVHVYARYYFYCITECSSRSSMSIASCSGALS